MVVLRLLRLTVAIIVSVIIVAKARLEIDRIISLLSKLSQQRIQTVAVSGASRESRHDEK